jgi:hypothetical protein
MSSKIMSSTCFEFWLALAVPDEAGILHEILPMDSLYSDIYRANRVRDEIMTRKDGCSAVKMDGSWGQVFQGEGSKLLQRAALKYCHSQV